MTNQVSIGSIFDTENIEEVKQLINPDYNLKKKYVVFDTKFRQLTGAFESPVSKFKFIYNDTGIPIPGTATSTGAISNVKAIRLYPAEISNIFSVQFKQLNVLIEEFKKQSYTCGDASNQFNAHWIFYNGIINDLLTPEAFIYRFAEQIPVIDTFTFSFNDSTQQLTIPFDRDTASVSYTPGTYITLTFDNAHSINFGAAAGRMIRLSITGFTTQNPAKDEAFCKFINSPYIALGVPGAALNQINLITRSTQYIDPAPVGLKVSVFFEDFRMIMPTEISYLKI